MIFTIKKNKHYSDNWLYKLTHFFNFKKQQSFKVIFDESCLYSGKDDSVNKLFGLSFGWHHNNSIRFGWQSHYGKIRIYTYLYIDGIRYIRKIGEVGINEECCLTIDNHRFSFKTKGTFFSMEGYLSPNKIKNKISYNLWPYFGGVNVAPHDIKIELIEII